MKVLIAAEYNYTTELSLRTVEDEFIERLEKIVSILNATLVDNWYNLDTGTYRYIPNKGYIYNASPFDLYVKTGLITKEEYEWFNDLLPDEIERVVHIFIIDITRVLM